LYDLTSKMNLAHEILTHERFLDKKAITFSQTTESADTLAALIGDGAEPYHSAVEGRTIHGQYYGKDRYLDLVIRRFKENILRVLSTAKALDEGADIPDVDLLLILSGTSTARQGLQRYGRGIRYIEGKHTIIIEIYAIDTQDERWLRGRQKRVPQNAIKWVRSIDEIG
jgi:superfamily II DNA or RNA helicase